MYEKYFKRVLDIVLSLFFAPFLLLIIAVCGIIIKFDDRGPVFYCSDRLGKDGRIFKMYKLRTMKVCAKDIRNSDGSTYNAEDDERLTRVGKILRKISMDELPQILNVLIGNMSFIGPRPDLPEHVLSYTEHEKKKLKVLPGISGYNQAYHRNSVGWKQRLCNDVYYVENLSFKLDIKIIIKTIAQVSSHEGIYSLPAEIRRKVLKQGGAENKLNIFQTDSFKAEALEWDTNYFGVTSAKVVLYDYVPEDERKLLSEIYDNYEFITIINEGNKAANNLWIGRETKALLADVNIRFAKDLRGYTAELGSGVQVINSYPQDEQILEIAHRAFKYSRFFNDPWLPRDKSEGIYVQWTQSAFNQQERYFTIAERQGRVAGFLLFGMDKTSASATIELIAVDEAYRGQKVGKEMLENMAWLVMKRNISTIKVGTQVDNCTAQNFYASCGFKHESCNSIYHYWPRK